MQNYEYFVKKELIKENINLTFGGINSVHI